MRPPPAKPGDIAATGSDPAITADLRQPAGADHGLDQHEIRAAILDALSAHIALVDPAGLIVAVNAAWRRFARINSLPGDCLGQNYLAVCESATGDDVHHAHAVAAGLRQVLAGSAETFSHEYPCHSPDERRWFLLTITPVSRSRRAGAVVAHTDISQRKAAELALQASESRFRATFEQTAVGIAHVAADGRFLRVNSCLCAMLGYERDELLTLTFSDLGFPEHRVRSEAAHVEMLAGTRTSFATEKRYRRKDGSGVWAYLVTTLVHDHNQTPYFISVVEDITARKAADLRLQRLNRLYVVLSRINETIVRVRKPRELYEQVCQIVVKDGLLRMAFIAEPRADSLAITPVAVAGEAGDYLSTLEVAADPGSPLAQGTIGTALRTGRHQVCNDFASDPRMAPWSAQAARNHFRATASFPLMVRGATVAALVLFADEADYFQQDEIALMVAVANDLSFALEAMRRERERLAIEESMLASERRFRALIEHGADGIALSDGAGRIIYLSPAVTAIEGYAQEELIGRSTMERIHPDDHEAMRAIMAKLLASPGTPIPALWRRQHKDGRWLWLEGVATNLLHDPAVGAIVTNYRDITERRQATAAYQEVAERLTTTLESITEAFYTLDRDWRFTYINHKAEQILRRSRDDLLGKVIWDEYPQARETPFHHLFQRSMREHVSEHFQEFYPPFAAWFEVHVYPSSQGLAIYIQDITEQRQALEGLRISEERFRLLAKATNDAVWDWDLLNDHLWWNEGLETLFGYAPGDVGTTSAAWTERIHPDDRARVLDQIHAAIAVGDGVWSDEYQFRRKDGSYAYISDRGQVICDATGKAVRMIGGKSDLSARKLAEERLAEQAALLDHAKDAISVRDLEHRITYWNKGAERIHGWSAAEVLGRSARDLIGPDAATFDQGMQTVLELNEWLGEWTSVRKDGRKILMEGRWTLVRDKRGEPRAVLAISSDITERRQLEQQFLRAQRLESIGTLAGGIAHDLNNVLTPILLSIGLLMRDEHDEKRLRTLSTIDTSAKRGADMVKQVLSFARGVEGQRLPVLIPDLIHDVEKIIDDTFLKNIQVRVHLGPDLWTVIGDPTQLHQVLLNLCVNARDAMPSGGTITLSAENLQIDGFQSQGEVKPGPYIVIGVEDTGTGIPAAIIGKIFEPFFTTKEFGQGTGLGLPTSLAMVRSHGGHLRVHSEPGQGTTFKIFLPATLTADQVGEGSDQVVLPRGDGELILVVDDESPVRQLTRQILETFGYRVLAASGGAEAVALCASHGDEIALVLTDMMMPVMDGHDTIRALIRMRPGIRIIAASGLADSAVVAKATSSGARHFLAKPYSAHTLLTTIREALTDRA